MKKFDPLVSIVIPTFNQIKYLPACFDHCMFQSYPALEIIIVDGGSTDDTKSYLNNLIDNISTNSCTPVIEMDHEGNIIRKEILVYPQNRKIQIVTFNEDIGATKTYNEGLKRVSGEFCTYIVGDDLPHPHMIEELYSCLKSTGADFVYSDVHIINDDGRIIRRIQLDEYQFEKCFASWYHLSVSHLYRSKWHNIVGLMDESYTAANDYDHYLRFAMSGAIFVHVPKILYSIRYHGKTRQTGQHTPERHSILIEESKQCAYRAREWLKKQI